MSVDRIGMADHRARHRRSLSAGFFAPGRAALTALVLHALIGAALLWSDRAPSDPAKTAATETPVEIVEEPPKAEPETPVTPQAPDTVPAKLEPAARETPQAPSPPAPAPPPPQAPATAAVPPAPNPAAGPVRPAPPAAEGAAAALGEPGAARPPPPPPVSAPVDKPAARKAATPGPSAATAEFFLVPESFEKAAAPAAGRETNDEYKGAVYERLEFAKGDGAGQRAAGAVVVTFMLDQAGNLVTLSLVRPTGNRELDAQAVALVRRAAPFPKPPPGVLLTFSPLVIFGAGEAPPR